jgi:hypothetical protein
VQHECMGTSSRSYSKRSECASASCWTRIPEWWSNMMEEDLNVMGSGLTLVQRVAICFAAGVIGGLAVVFFSHLLFALGVSAILGVNEPVSLKSPEIYRPLFWAGLWGIPFGLLIKAVWRRLYFFGLLYFFAPVLALFMIFLPMSGAGYFGLQRGPRFTLYLLLVNLPYGIITALAARAIIGKKP